MLGKTPKPFNTVNVILSSFVDHALTVVNGMMFAPSLQGVVALELVGEVDRTLPRLLSDDLHQFLRRDSLNNPRVDPAITFQEPKHNAFTLGASSTHSFASTAKVALIHLNLARQFASLKFSNMVDQLTEVLIHSRHCLVVQFQVMRQFVGRLLLVEAFQNSQLSAQLSERLLSAAGCSPASDVSSSCSTGFKRTTENTLSTPQKVGLTTENVLSPLRHMDILVSYGYDYH